MPKEKIHYFISILNSNIFTVKNKMKLETNNQNTINRNNHTLLNNKNLRENTSQLLNFCFDFLQFPDYMPLLLLNKKLNPVICRKLYKKILLGTPNLRNKKRFEVWKSILKLVRNFILFSLKRII